MERSVSTWTMHGKLVAELFEENGRYTAVGYFPSWSRNWGDCTISGGWKSERTGERAINATLRRVSATGAIKA